jgi:hypothetical protein
MPSMSVFRTNIKIYEDYFPRQNSLVFVIKTQWPICGTETECWSIIYMNFRLPRVLTDVFKSQSYKYFNIQYAWFFPNVLFNNAVLASNVTSLTECVLSHMYMFKKLSPSTEMNASP